jgi:hypothetical protein
MSAGRDRGLVIGMIVVLIGGLWLLRPASDDIGPPYQVSGRGPAGLSGLGAGLRASGVKVAERNQPTLAASGLTVVVAPVAVSHDDSDSWRRSLTGGATMIYAADRPDPFTRSLGVRFVRGGAVAPGLAAQTFPLMHPPGRAPEAVRLPPLGRSIYVAGNGAVFAMIPVGDGVVWLLTDPAWLTNQHVSRTALPFVLPLARLAGDSAQFDQYHRSGAGHLNALDYLPRAATLLVIELALGGLLLVGSLMRRRGPLWPETAHAPVDDLSLAPSVASLYERNGAVDTMTAALADADERRLGARAVKVKDQLARLRAAADADAAVEAWQNLDEAERRSV